MRVVAVTPVKAPFAVWPLFKVPLIVLVDPVRVSAFVPRSKVAFASTVKEAVAVMAPAAVTVAAVFEMNK